MDQLLRKLEGHQAERITPPGTHPAAVLIPLLEKDGEPCILFEKRSADVPQGGEICFPGGMIERKAEGTVSSNEENTRTEAETENADTPAENRCETPAEAAVRETSEELLIDPGKIELTAPLHVMAGPGGREVYSFLGILHDYHGTASKSEVAYTFCVPVSTLLKNPPEIHEAKMRLETKDDFPFHLIPGGRAYPIRTVPRRFYFYQTEHGVIWGMTAELLYHFLKLIA